MDVGVQDPSDPRYTVHEFDVLSGFNYMKGRFQLATYAKFNRPDPMRDWNWLAPHTINLYEYVGNDPVNKWDPTGFNNDLTKVKDDAEYMAYLAAWKATPTGKEQWDQLENHPGNFVWEKTDLDGAALGKVHSYQMDPETKELTGATITLDPEFFKKNPVPSGKDGYEDAMDHGSKKANRVAGVAHEAEHAVYATEPGAAEKLVQSEELNKKIKAAADSLPLDEYQKVYVEQFKDEAEKNKAANVENERRAVSAGNDVGQEFKDLTRKQKREIFKKDKE